MRSILAFLGFSGDPKTDSDAIHRIAAELDRLEPGRARYLAAFAFVLSRVARADQRRQLGRRQHVPGHQARIAGAVGGDGDIGAGPVGEELAHFRGRRNGMDVGLAATGDEDKKAEGRAEQRKAAAEKETAKADRAEEEARQEERERDKQRREDKGLLGGVTDTLSGGR